MAPTSNLPVDSYDAQILLLAQIQTIATCIGLAAIIFTIVPLVHQRYLGIRASDDNKIACEFAWLGIFASEKVSYFGTIMNRRTVLKSIPTLHTILAMGDAYAWTSRAILYATRDLNRCGWVVLLEAILLQIAHDTDISVYNMTQTPVSIRDYTERIHNSEDREVLEIRRSSCRLYQGVDPVLINCTRRLDRMISLTPMEDDRMSPKMVHDGLQKSHIAKDRIWLPASGSEVFALALTLGMPLRIHEIPQILRGRGAFLSTLDTMSRDFGTSCNFSIGSPDTLKARLPPCSGGYSTLMARNIACGSIPFAENDRWVYSVFVNSNVLQALIEGRPLTCVAGYGGEGLQQLWDLPSHKQLASYFHSVPIGQARLEDIGKIMRMCGTHQPVQVASVSRGPSFCASWARVVTGIAFGGLVPLATQNLVDAISFTCGQYATGTTNKLEELLDDICGYYSRLYQDDAEYIFGTTIYKRVNGRAWVECDNWESQDRLEVNEACDTFHRYMTLLEIMAAMTFSCHVFGTTSPCNQTASIRSHSMDSSNKNSQRKPHLARLSSITTDAYLEDLLSHSSQFIDKGYRDAVASKGSTRKGVSFSRRNIDLTIDTKVSSCERDIVVALGRLRGKLSSVPIRELTMDDFALVLKAILSAWAYQVPLRSFSDDSIRDKGSRSRAMNTSNLVLHRAALIEDIGPVMLG